MSIVDKFVSNEVKGLYRALVVNDQDPTRRGRVQIRIPALHGVPNSSPYYVSDVDLPWAAPGSLHGLGPGSGELIIPQPGMIVFVMFEGNNVKSPIYFGTVALLKNAHAIGNAPAGSDCVLADVYSHDGKVAIDLIYRSSQGSQIQFDREDGSVFVGTLDDGSYWNGVRVNGESLYLYKDGQEIDITQVTYVTMSYAEALSVLRGTLVSNSEAVDSLRLSNEDIDELFQ